MLNHQIVFQSPKMGNNIYVRLYEEQIVWTFFQSNDSQNVVSRPAASASHGNVLEMQILYHITDLLS